MKNIIIIGAGGFSKELIGYLQQDISNKSLTDIHLKGILDDHESNYLNNDYDLPYLGKINDYHPLVNDEFLLAIANIHARKIIVRTIKNNNGIFFTYIHPSALIATSATIGEGSIICPFSIINAKASVGELCVLNIFCSIGHDTTLGGNSVLSPYCTLNGNVVSGASLFMGTRSTILLGNKVGNNCTISAHTCVKDDVPDNQMVFTKEEVNCILDRRVSSGVKTETSL